MKLALSFFFLLFSVWGLAQVPYGNEWIRKNQPYVKIKVSENDLYKISYSQLQSLNFLSSNPDPKNFQIFYQGKEIPVLIAGESDGSFDTNDYILFYGEKNKGKADRILYESAAMQPNEEVSLFTDESCYFLTWSSGTAGKRYQKTVLSGSTLLPEPYIIYTSSVNLESAYYPGQYLLDVMSLSEFVNGEGYMGQLFEKGKSQSHSLSTPNRSNDPTFTPYAEFYVAGRSNALSVSGYNHHLRVQINAHTIKDTLFKGYETIRSRLDLSPSLITDASTVTFSSIDDLSAATDYQTPAYARITYARNTDIAGLLSLKFKVSSSQAQNLLRFSNSSATDLILLDTAKAYFYEAVPNLDKSDFIIHNPGQSALFLQSLSSAKTPIIENVSFNLIEGTSFSDNLLIVTHPSLKDAALEFAAYKKVRGFSPFVVTTEELYNQFYYGIHHPQAIRNFARYLLGTASTKPEYLLLLGKGYETPKYNLSADLVPTMGYPASDAAFTSQIIDNNLAPALATGRIPAKTSAEVRDYLAKVQAYDALPGAMYRKNFIHISGGKDAFENSSFVNYLKGLATIARGEYKGASIVNFNKNVSDPVTDNITEKIVQSISSGAELVSYLGHGNIRGTEISLGTPSSYSQDRLLFYLINGCSTGNAFTSATSMGEDYLLQKNRGAIGWIGTSSEGVASYLMSFSNSLYKHSFKNNYGSSVSANIRAALREYQNQNDLLNRAHARQYMFLGDPTLAFYSPGKADYSISNEDIFLTDKNLTSHSKIIKLGIIVKNPGKALVGNLVLSVKRTLNDNSVISYPPQTYNAPLNTDTLYYIIDNEAVKAAGNNKFTVTLDPANQVSELNETNNSATLNHFFPSNGIILISPAVYSIESEPSLTLKVQQNALLSKDAEYLFEIDTITTFDSPWKKSSSPIRSKLFATWQPAISMEANKVYYWRARLNIPEAEGGSWQNSSFTFIPGSERGWNQGHYQQFDKISFDKMEAVGKGSFQFEKTSYPLLIKTRGDLAPTGTERAIRVSTSGGKLSFNTSEFQGLALVAMGPVVQNSFVNYPSEFNYKNDGLNGTGQFYFDPNNPTQADSLVRFIDNIPEGYYVVGMSGLNLSPKDLPAKVKTAFSNLGLSSFNSVGSGEPYAFSGKKGAPAGSARELTADYSSLTPAREQAIELSLNLPYPLNSGSYTSEPIGPATKWNIVKFDFRKDNYDQLQYSVVGIKKDGTESSLVGNATNPDIDISFISADEFPFIKLKAQTIDNTNFTPAQLTSWKVLYESYNEIGINTDISNEFHAYTIDQGDSLKLKLGVANHGKSTSDSIKVSYKIIKHDRTTIEGSIGTLAPLNAAGINLINFTYPTDALIDSNILQVSIEPKDQKDLIDLNNHISYHFFVRADKKEPLVDVLFDGQRIINGETVSPKPQIAILLTDENRFLLLNDTTLVEVYLRSGKDDTDKRIAFSSNKISLQNTGTAENNKASYLFIPEQLEDGVYTLRIRSKDRSGNYSASNDYEVSFEVINESSISHFLPYPNPFSTSMRFVFKVTGQKVPDKLKVQIMTVSGKVVREVLKEELGDIRIGNNISAFTWDGTDQFGDKLANGVYFYRVIAEHSDGSDLKHKASAADSMFKKNFGKIYLMR